MVLVHVTDMNNSDIPFVCGRGEERIIIVVKSSLS
jgi:hypothetical protein